MRTPMPGSYFRIFFLVLIPQGAQEAPPVRSVSFTPFPGWFFFRGSDSDNVLRCFCNKDDDDDDHNDVGRGDSSGGDGNDDDDNDHNRKKPDGPELIK